jgi:hypothetical protein
MKELTFDNPNRRVYGTKDYRHANPDKCKMIAVRFTDKTFNKIARQAKEANISFAEQIRRLVEGALAG